MTDGPAAGQARPLPYALGFVGGGLERHAERRGAATALAAVPEARALLMWRGRPLVSGPPEAPRLAWRPLTAPLPGQGDGEGDGEGDSQGDSQRNGARIYLGEVAGHDGLAGPLFAIDISGWAPEGADPGDPGPGRWGEDQPAPPELGGPEPDARFADLRALTARLAPFDAEVAATAKGILEWHRTHGFCAACGAPSVLEQGGWQRRCPACGRAHFPRTDPVVIMLVTDGNRLLIGRSPAWPEGFYSLLAGFMEPGETVAAAVRREVAEETAVACGRVRLLNSQPWPFPASLMIGCIAEATSRAITVDPAELDDALWVTREELLAIYAGTHPTITAPRHGAIAGHLMHLWLADRLDSSDI
ncbi:MAG: NAD(+) diphosphatase [Maritimibacter sp.]|nr:NAD(+) diphosphatase [Maritimibacter sp.]